MPGGPFQGGEGVDQFGVPGESRLGPAGQHLTKQRGEIRGDFGAESAWIGPLGVDMAVELLRDVPTRERRLTGEEEVERAAQRIDVAPYARGAAVACLLG